MGLTDDNHQSAYAYLAALESGDVERGASSGVGQGSIGYGGGGPVWLDDFRSKRPPTPTELVNSYKSVAFACISLNANAVAKIPLRLYCRTGGNQAKLRFWPAQRLNRAQREVLNGRMHRNKITRALTSPDDDVDEILEHPLLAVLDSPNEYFDGNLLIQLLCRQLDVIGQAYWIPDRTGEDWAPTKLWPLLSQHCYPVKGSGRTVINHYRYFDDRYEPDQIIRFRFSSVRDPYLSGYSPLHACFEQLGLVGYYTAVVESMLKTGARPSLIVGPKDATKPFTEIQRKRLEVDINNRFANGQQGRVWVMDGAVEAKEMTYPPSDMASLQVSKDARLIAANCFDVPISMLESESSNRAVASEGATQHQRNAVDPRCAIISSALTHQLARKIDPRLFFAFDDPIQKDRVTDSKVDSLYLDRSVYTINEVRAAQGMEAVEWGDEPIKDQPTGGDDNQPGDDPAEEKTR